MSRRRTRRRKLGARAGAGRTMIGLGVGCNAIDPSSGALDIVGGVMEITDEDAAVWDLYSRAHALLPPTRSTTFDPCEYAALVPDTIRYLKIARFGTDPDSVLCALALLGHTPSSASLEALIDFASFGPEDCLNRVARLAIAECIAIGNAFGIFTAAS